MLYTFFHLLSQVTLYGTDIFFCMLVQTYSLRQARWKWAEKKRNKQWAGKDPFGERLQDCQLQFVLLLGWNFSKMTYSLKILDVYLECLFRLLDRRDSNRRPLWRAFLSWAPADWDIVVYVSLYKVERGILNFINYSKVFPDVEVLTFLFCVLRSL